jgi:hypothetical protein
MQIFGKYRHQFIDEVKVYTVHLVDSICTCSEDNTDNLVLLNWNGASVSGDMPNDVLIGVSNFITELIQNMMLAGIILEAEET